ncbi:Secreted RxLR effector peptide protein [Phytophthora palmivora]|uniref:Secreted RxLR effector peptide protein n=1 Tax=Phytophthora palmivora TaxID=4796 RepID=A0A2P4YQ58_9STRA|nr:Secreted RxLR effector peptide protein [Phytophthora palmivora]
MKYWLFRGIAPEEVLKNLKITSTTDKNYKYYSRYYVKYPGRQPPNLPTKTAEDIMMARLYDWLRNNRTPPEVFKELGFTGTFASARGQPNYEYFELYSEMWSALQVRLSQASTLHVYV